LDWVDRKQAEERDRRGRWFTAAYGVGATGAGVFLAWLIPHLLARLP